jgi:exodeoxyribonuclease V alpha subunit
VAASVAVAPPARLDALWVRLPESGDGASDAVLAALQALVRHTLPAAGLDPRTQLQVITPMRRGPHGAGALCAALAPLLNPRSDSSSANAPELSRGSTVYRIGDRVLQAVNDYTKEVFNGDLGTVRAVDVGARRVSVDFGRAAGGAVDYTGAELEALLPAWAVTVHKAQGSEFPAVVLLLNAGAPRRAARARALLNDAALRRALQFRR